MKRLKHIFENIGPGPLVAAAFVGPGTVTLCTLAGAEFGYALLWALTLSVIITIVLQEMSARLGIITQKGLAENLMEALSNPLLKGLSVLLIISAIAIGNAAYESGNISGAAAGLELVFGDLSFQWLGLQLKLGPLIIGAIAFLLLFLGNYKQLERLLISLVGFMSLAFLVTAVAVKPNLSGLVKFLFLPRFPDQSVLTVLGLIGTTVVPYNLFLHSALAAKKWSSPQSLKQAKKDTVIAVIVGGIISMTIVISAASMQDHGIAKFTDLSKSLMPVFGGFSPYILATGVVAAGITSAITAPLATAFVVAGCFGWSVNLKSFKFRSVWMIILLLGTLTASIGLKPIEVIKFAQITNGILLPVIALFLLWITSRSNALGIYKNKNFQVALGCVIVIITVILGFKGIYLVFN